MTNTKLELAVRLGMEVFAEKTVSKATIVDLLKDSTLGDLRKMYKSACLDVVSADVPSESEFLKCYASEKWDEFSRGGNYSEFFDVTYIDEVLLPSEPNSDGVTFDGLKNVTESSSNYVSSGKLFTLIEFLESIGYESGDLKIEIGKIGNSWRKLPYTEIILDYFGISILFNEQKRQGTFIIKHEDEIDAVSYKSDLPKPISFHVAKPYLYKLSLLEEICPDRFENFRDNHLLRLRNEYGSPSKFLETEIKDIEKNKFDELNLKEFTRYVLKMNVGPNFTITNKVELAKNIWPEEPIEILSDLSHEAKMAIIKTWFPDFADFFFSNPVNLNQYRYNGYTLQNIATSLGIKERVIKLEGRWELCEILYGVKEDEYLDLIKDQYKSGFDSKADFVNANVKDMKDFSIFDGKLGIKRVYKLFFGKTISYFSTNMKLELADVIWE